MKLQKSLLLDVTQYQLRQPAQFGANKITRSTSILNGVIGGGSSILWNLFDIYFLRKERTYTKLKYSRVPQYDMVSGGGAAVFAGFMGFLICEKFGLELLDSGDLYIVFMYVVFLCFFIRLLLKLISSNSRIWSCLSLKWLIFFIYQLFLLGCSWGQDVGGRLLYLVGGY